MMLFRKSRAKRYNDKKISVIIPVYNHEKYVKEAIESVLNQTHENIELIVIDDGSKDHSFEIACSIADTRVTVLNQENQGAHATINRGLNLATGEYLSILNSDDAYENNRLEKCIDYLCTHEEVHMVCSYIKIVNGNGKVLGLKKGWENMEPWPIAHKERTFAKYNDFHKNLLMSNFISTTSNMFFTKKLYQDIGGMRNLRFAHDWDFALRAAEYANCAILEDGLMRYRIHDSNTIHSNRKHMLFEICWIYAANLHRFEKEILFKGNLMTDFEEMAESLNLQGNDKMVWLIRSYLNAAASREVENPELVLLDRPDLREKLIEYIVE